MITKIKLLMFLLLALAALPAAAQTRDQPGSQYGLGYGMFAGLGNQDLRIVIASLIQVVLSFLGIILLLMILWGGFQVLISLGNDEKRSKGIRTIISAIIGTIIILSSFSIAQFVINSLTQATGAV